METTNFCPSCGAPVNGGGFCARCGNPLPTAAASAQPQQPVQPMPTPQYATAPVRQVVDSGSFGWAVLGFLIPIVGLVLWLVWKNTKPLSAKKAGVGALVSVIISVVLYAIGAVATMGMYY